MLNQATLIGNLGADPELRYTPSGKAVANFRIATNDRYSDQPEWHRVVVWGKVAEACSKHLSKGRSVCVQGKIQYRKWDDRDGNTRYTTEIVATGVTFLPGGSRGETQQNLSSGVPVADVDEPELNEDAQQMLGSDEPF